MPMNNPSKVLTELLIEITTYADKVDEWGPGDHQVFDALCEANTVICKALDRREELRDAAFYKAQSEAQPQG